ncbi:hypothetical protein OHR68_03420 [Spirillospora sp. NBC_00431]
MSRGLWKRVRPLISGLLCEIGYVAAVSQGHFLPSPRRRNRAGQAPDGQGAGPDASGRALDGPPRDHPERISRRPPTGEERKLWAQLGRPPR